MCGDPESHGLTPASFSVLTTEGGAANETTNTERGAVRWNHPISQDYQNSSE